MEIPRGLNFAGYLQPLMALGATRPARAQDDQKSVQFSYDHAFAIYFLN